MNKKKILIVITILIVVILFLVFVKNKKNNTFFPKDASDSNVNQDVLEESEGEINSIRYDPMTGRYVDSISGRIVEYDEELEN